jgi:pectin methylesterase-like acyl-CoA thioesterase
MPTVIVKQAASNKMQFEQCELMECQESLFSQTSQFLLVSRISHSKEQAFYL